MRDEGRDVDEVAGAGLGDELKLVAPAHARLAAHHVDHALYRAMMVRAGLGLGVDDDGAGPEFLGAGAGVGDGGGAIHAGGLRGVDVELVGVDDAHARVLPFGFGGHGRIISPAQPTVPVPASGAAGTTALVPARWI